jgi:hypothetical protein
VNFEELKRIAQNEFEDMVIVSCKDIGNSLAFSYETTDGDVIPDVPIVCVDKSDGSIEYMTIPPIENLIKLEKGKEIQI